MKVKLINKSENLMPWYSTLGSAGMDIRANLPITKELGGKSTLQPGERFVYPTGLHIGLPVGYEAQIRPRSGMAIKHGVTVLNSPGTIDSDYTGEIGVILINHSDKPFDIKHGDRIAQMVIAKYEEVEWDEVKELDATERGDGGYGSTGKK